MLAQPHARAIRPLGRQGVRLGATIPAERDPARLEWLIACERSDDVVVVVEQVDRHAAVLPESERDQRMRLVAAAHRGEDGIDERAGDGDRLELELAR